MIITVMMKTTMLNAIGMEEPAVTILLMDGIIIAQVGMVIQGMKF